MPRAGHVRALRCSQTVGYPGQICDCLPLLLCIWSEAQDHSICSTSPLPRCVVDGEMREHRRSTIALPRDTHDSEQSILVKFEELHSQPPTSTRPAKVDINATTKREDHDHY